MPNIGIFLLNCFANRIFIARQVFAEFVVITGGFVRSSGFTHRDTHRAGGKNRLYCITFGNTCLSRYRKQFVNAPANLGKNRAETIPPNPFQSTSHVTSLRHSRFAEADHRFVVDDQIPSRVAILGRPTPGSQSPSRRADRRSKMAASATGSDRCRLSHISGEVWAGTRGRTRTDKPCGGGF